MSYSGIILGRTGLINYWRLGDAASPYADSGPGGLSLADNGAFNPGGASLLDSDPANASVTGTAGAAGGALSSAGSYTWASGACSIEAWIYPTTSTAFNIGIAGAWLASGAMLLIGLVGTNNLRFYTGATALDFSFVCSVNTRYHIVGTYDGTDRRGYVDGSLVAGPTAGSDPGSTPGNFMVGNYNSSGQNGFIGRIDEVSTYSVALSASDVAASYAAGIASAVLGSSRSIVF